MGISLGASEKDFAVAAKCQVLDATVDDPIMAIVTYSEIELMIILFMMKECIEADCWHRTVVSSGF